MCYVSLKFGLFDFTLHHTFEVGKANQVLDTLKAVKDKVAVIKGVEWARAPHSFSISLQAVMRQVITAIYGLKCLSADAFSRFEEEGIFNPVTGKSFLDEILTRGGSEEPMVLFKRFRGREPQLDALLRHKGIAN